MSTARRGRGALVARGAVASAVTTLLAAVSHTLGGGAAPAPTIVLGVIVLLILPAGLMMTARGSRPAGAGRIAATTLVAHLAFHGVFTALGGPVAGVSVTGGHHHGSAAPVDLAVPAHVHAESAGMLVAHAAAALVTFAILAYGERAVRGGARWLRATARRFARRRPLPSIPRLIARSAPRIRPLPVAAPATGVRGPPVRS